ncbi:hypothetical protein D3C79_910250 [compost metagenome]
MAVFEAQLRVFRQPLFQADHLAFLIGHGAVGVTGEAPVFNGDANRQRAVGTELFGNRGDQMFTGGGNDQNAVAAFAVPQQPLTCGGINPRQDIAPDIALYPTGHRLGA